jgi:hypothetical protein
LPCSTNAFRIEPVSISIDPEKLVLAGKAFSYAWL